MTKTVFYSYLKTLRKTHLSTESIKKSMETHRVVLMRHGTSEWNHENKFCGWVDVDLSEKGIQETIKAADLIKDANYKFDVAFTSSLRRAQRTLEILLEKIGLSHIPVRKSWYLNERHYGALSGMNRIAIVEKYGLDQVKTWRRSYDVAPPPLHEDHPYYDTIYKAKSDEDGPSEENFPMTESLKTTYERVIPYWNQHIVPEIKANKNVLIVTHGSTCRTIVKHLEDISDADISNVNIPIAIPFQYDLDENMKAVLKMKFLGDQKEAQTAMKNVEDQLIKDL